jgi:hypothetical protein
MMPGGEGLRSAFLSTIRAKPLLRLGAVDVVDRSGIGARHDA